MYGDTTHATLVCLIAAIDDQDVVTDMDKTYTNGDRDEKVELRFIDRFMTEAIEAGLIDASATWGSPAWQEAVEEVHPDAGDHRVKNLIILVLAGISLLLTVLGSAAIVVGLLYAIWAQGLLGMQIFGTGAIALTVGLLGLFAIGDL